MVEKQKKKKTIRIVLWIMILAVIIALAIVAGFYFSLDNYGKNETASRAGEKGISFEIKKGDTTSSIAERLVKLKMIQNPTIFKLVAKKNGVSTQFKPGFYQVSWGNSYLEIMKELMGKPMTVKIMIPEHYNAIQAAEKIEKAGFGKAEDLLNYLQSKSYSYKFVGGIPSERNPKYEGYMFPATYEFELGQSIESIGDTLIATFDRRFTKDRYKKAKQIGFTVDEVVKLASIVEREAANASEFRTVAGIFINRMKINQKLESCATIQYVFATDDDPNTNLKDRISGSDTQIDNPYNTYRFSGLPPGPICSPGIGAIDAVLDYERHNYRYMVLKPDGTHDFSESFAEHDAKVREYLG